MSTYSLVQLLLSQSTITSKSESWYPGLRVKYCTYLLDRFFPVELFILRWVLQIWNIWSQLKSCVKILPNHTKAVRNVEWSDDGRKLLSCSYDKTASVIDVEKGILSQYLCFMEGGFVPKGDHSIQEIFLSHFYLGHHFKHLKFLLQVASS